MGKKVTRSKARQRRQFQKALSTDITDESLGYYLDVSYNDGSTLKEAALELGLLSEEEFDKWVVPENMVGKS